VCAPDDSVDVVNGDVQVVNAPVSTEHWNVEGVSLDENANVGVLTPVGPLGPDVIVVSGGVVSTVKALVAGVASVFPAASVARTESVYEPSRRDAGVYGEEHVENVTPSRAHANVEPASLDENVKVGVESAVAPVGPPVIAVSGGVVSPGCTVHEWVAGLGSTFPAVSVARTANVCAPATTVYCAGDEQAANAAPSSEHANVASVSVAVNVKLALPLVVVAGGPDAIAVSGATVSTVNVRVAGVPSAFPAASVARTEKVCDPLPSDAAVTGEEQAAKSAPSSAHANVELLSLEMNANVAVVSLVAPLGPDVIVVSGAVVSSGSTVHVCAAGVPSVFPAASVARTRRVCVPSPTVSAKGAEQGSKPVASSAHSNPDAVSLELKVKVALVLIVPAGGAVVIVVSGAVRSIVKVMLAGAASTFPAVSVACTWNV
jgi:hypothetical protein